MPHGSVLGPLFFFVYISGITDGLQNDIRLFADGTSFYSVGKDKDEATANLNQDLEKVSL